ncbi:MAG: hypothetical protein C0596_16630 [Marinilabiliales bacterium]|nr:MAG: hypothetical protein C0596_16630 [Marinilabiliales bacterium]
METAVRGYLLKDIIIKNDFFTVYNAEHSVLKGQKLSITIINEDFAERQDIRSAFSQSAFKLSFAEHENLIKNIDLVEENNKLAILSEYHEFEDFINVIDSLNRSQRIQIIRDVFNLCYYLHSRNIFISDLRLENFVWLEGKVYLSNLGISNMFLKSTDQELLNTLEEKLYFTAPELFEANNEPNVISDIYTLSMFIDFILIDVKDLESDLKYLLKRASSKDVNSRFLKLKEFEAEVMGVLGDNDSEEVSNEGDFDSYSSKMEQMSIDSPSISEISVPDTSFDSLNADDIEIETNGLEIEVESSEIDNEVVIDEQVKSAQRNEERVKSKPEQKPQAEKKEEKASSKNYYDILAEIEAEKKRKLEEKQNAQAQKEREASTRHTVYQTSNSPKKGFQNNTQTKKQTTSYNQPKAGVGSGYQNKPNYQSNKTSQSNHTFQSQSKISTANVLILGVIVFIFAFAVPFVGFVLSIIGLSQLGKNNRKARLQGRKMTSAEKGPQSIGTVLCVIALITSIIKMIVFFTQLVM